ncbi:hypothetical protein B0H14DRAFT_3764751 [Mycena olivaceomarginata]|nr:hypothetical protein B0H14DRAFT_3764751 [Mycena olivaceomarginata]
MPSTTLETVTAPSSTSPPTDGSAPYTLPLSNWAPEKHNVQIENVRGKEDTYLLDEAGFQFFHRPASHKSFLDDEEIKAEYYPESEELIKDITGASRLAPSLLEHRFQIINLWRPIGHPAFDMPLTLCDFRTVDAERDLVAARLAPERKGETYRVRYDPEHRWKYLKGMTPEEFVVIKCFDSAEGVSVFTPHTAFLDPSMPEGSPPRESIELRALVFYN